jgi:hypothetical protein
MFPLFERKNGSKVQELFGKKDIISINYPAAIFTSFFGWY